MLRFEYFHLKRLICPHSYGWSNSSLMTHTHTQTQCPHLYLLWQCQRDRRAHARRIGNILQLTWFNLIFLRIAFYFSRKYRNQACMWCDKLVKSAHDNFNNRDPSNRFPFRNQTLPLSPKRMCVTVRFHYCRMGTKKRDHWKRVLRSEMTRKFSQMMALCWIK